MNYYSPNRLISHWRSTLTMTVACVAWCRAGSSASAPEDGVPVLVSSLVLSTVPPLPVLSRMRVQLDTQARRQVDSPDGGNTALRSKSVDDAAWAKFEAEYRPELLDPSSFKSQIETAKYGLDTTVFAFDRFVKSIRDHADFGFDQSRLPSPRANTRSVFLENPRVKLDLDLTRGKPYIGVRVVIAFGN